MKAVLVGLGNFGSYWYGLLKEHARAIELICVDSNSQLKDRIDPFMTYYPSLEEAIGAERPDFVINVTPPHVHTSINEIAFAHGLPVLCEKPISGDLFEARAVVQKAEKLGIPFMISENYRFFAPVRKAKELLDRRQIGELSSVHIEFARNHEVTVPYFAKLKHPLLEDVTIHHFDMVRYFTGREAVAVTARSGNPPGTWLAANIHLNASMLLEGGTLVDYYGSLAANSKQTEWYGEWRFDGTEGYLILSAGRVELARKGETPEIFEFAHLGDVWSIDEFLAALRERREPRPSGRDYLKSQTLVFAAGKSSDEGRTVRVAEIFGEGGDGQ